MAYLLHIDTATDKGLYFLAKDGEIVAQKDSGSDRDHAATLAGLVASLLHEAGISFQDIEGIAVNGGPGSYTGLRIGLAAAKGYCFALQIPLLLENRLLLLLHTAGAQEPDKNWLAILPARTGEYFAAALDETGALVLTPQHITATSLEKWLSAQSGPFAGIGAVLADLQVSAVHPPAYDPGIWAKNAYRQFTTGAFSNLATAEPYYLKAAFTTQPRKSQPSKGM